jgi:hypothetical protein
LPISAVDTIQLAFHHTKRQLIQPFRFWQWTRLAVVGLLAGETGSSGGANFPTNFNIPRNSGSPRHLLSQTFPDIDPATLIVLIAILVAAVLVFAIGMMYVSSVMRFILFDSILMKECRIRQGWARRQGIGWHYFLWQVGFSLATLGGLAILLGIPAGFGYAMGWFNQPREHLVPLIVGGILLFFALLMFFVGIAVVHVMTKDFVVPQMALEGVSAVEGWRRLWPMLQGEQGGYAIYILMKIVLALGAGIVVAIATFIIVLIILVPTAGVVIAAVLGGKAAGLTWDVATITLAIVAGCVLLAVFMYLVALLSVPVIVFFPAYSVYFFAPRYRALSLALYPPPPLASPPREPPPQAPLPQTA